MRIDNMTITYDGICYHLIEKKKGISKKTGKEIESKKVTYYPTLELALLAMRNKVIDVKTVDTLLESLKESTDMIIKKVKEIQN